MRKIFAVLFVALLALPMSAQVLRNGNTYNVDGQNMKKKAFAEYMQANAEASLANKFKSGLTVANAGWGLFGGGLALEVGGFFCTASSGAAGMRADEKGKSAGKTVSGMALAGTAMYIVGSCAVTASIVCLGVGYARMHNTADAYAMMNNNRKDQPQAYLSVKADGNGLGLALNF